MLTRLPALFGPILAVVFPAGRAAGLPLFLAETGEATSPRLSLMRLACDMVDCAALRVAVVRT